MAVEPLSEPKVEALTTNCQIFLKETGFARRNLRLFKFNTARNERILNEVSGVQFINDDVPGPIPLDANKVPEDKNLKQVLEWFELYQNYSISMERLQRSLGRYVGENSKALDNARVQVSDDEERDPEADAIRLRGRIKIFEEALKIEEASKKYPMTILFPRASRRIKGEVILQRVSSLLVQKTFRSRKELKFFYKNDLKELGRLEGFLVAREIEQAELFLRIRKFHESFPKGAYEKLQTRLRKAEERRTQANARGESIPDPRLDPFYARDYAIVDLFQRAANFLVGTDPKITALRPTDRSLKFMEGLTNSGSGYQTAAVRSWEPLVRRYMQWSYDWMGAINKSVALIRQPIVTYSGLLIIVGAMSTGLTWTYQTVVRPAHDYVAYDADELKAREHFESLIEMQKTISDVSVTYQDFYTRFRDYALANFSDEAITVAFEYLRKIRPTLEATEKLDPGFNPAQLANYTRQAKEIVARRDALLFGYKSKFGNITGVSLRLDRRGKNYFLVEEIWKAENPTVIQIYGPVLPPPPSAPKVERKK